MSTPAPPSAQLLPNLHNPFKNVLAKSVVKFVVKLKDCQIGTIICVIVDMDPMSMIVVTERQKDKKTKNKKWQKGKKTKRLID